jgi:hypothetical protein
VPLLTYGRESLLRPILLGATLAVLSRLRPASLAAGWLPLLSAGVVTAAMIVILGTIIGLDRADRVQFLYAPLQRLKERLLADQSIRGATVREPRASTIGPHD